MPKDNFEESINIYNSSTGTEKRERSVGDWLMIDRILTLPIIGLVMLFVWANDPENIDRANFAKANILLNVVPGTICFFFFLCALIYSIFWA